MFVVIEDLPRNLIVGESFLGEVGILLMISKRGRRMHCLSATPISLT